MIKSKYTMIYVEVIKLNDSEIEIQSISGTVEEFKRRMDTTGERKS